MELFFSIVLFIFSILLIQLNKNTKKMELRNSPIHGRGMFALQPIKKDELIEVCPLIIIERDKDLAEDSLLKKYDIAFGEKNHAIMLGYGSIYNHSDNNNAQWIFVEKQLHVIATKDIRPNEEICVSYGSNYWIYRDDKK
jgi:SET domain-containing protein